MKSRLYPNIKHLTNMFCVGILLITVSILALRLTVLSDMAYASNNRTGLMDLTFGELENGEALIGRLSTSAYFSKPEARGSLQMENPKENEGYHMQVKVTVDGTGTLIYDSGWISAGSVITSRQLKSEAKFEFEEDGAYVCTAAVSMRDPDKNVLGEQAVPITLYIGEKPQDETREDDPAGDDK